MAYFHTTVLDNQIKALPTVDTASGSVATFDTDMTENLVSCVAEIEYSGGGGTPSTPVPIIAYNSCTITINSITYVCNFNSTVGRGIINVSNGKLYKTYNVVDLGNYNWTFYPPVSAFPYGAFYTTISGKKSGVSNFICSNYPNSLTGTTDQSILGNANNSLIDIIDDSYGGDAVAFKTAMSGVMLCYELNAPQNIQCNALDIPTSSGLNTVTADTGNISECKYLLSVGKAIS